MCDFGFLEDLVDLNEIQSPNQVRTVDNLDHDIFQYFFCGRNDSLGNHCELGMKATFRVVDDPQHCHMHHYCHK